MDQPSYSGSNLASSSDIDIEQLPALYFQNQQSVDNANLFSPNFQQLQQNESQLSQSAEAMNNPFDETEQKPDLAKISKGKYFFYIGVILIICHINIHVFIFVNIVCHSE